MSLAVNAVPIKVPFSPAFFAHCFPKTLFVIQVAPFAMSEEFVKLVPVAGAADAFSVSFA